MQLTSTKHCGGVRAKIQRKILVFPASGSVRFWTAAHSVHMAPLLCTPIGQIPPPSSLPVTTIRRWQPGRGLHVGGRKHAWSPRLVAREMLAGSVSEPPDQNQTPDLISAGTHGKGRGVVPRSHHSDGFGEFDLSLVTQSLTENVTECFTINNWIESVLRKWIPNLLSHFYLIIVTWHTDTIDSNFDCIARNCVAQRTTKGRDVQILHDHA